MHLTKTVSAVAALAVTATAQLDAAPIILKIAPGSASCDATNADCRTAEQAAPLIAQAFVDREIYSTKVMAAVIALMAFESVDFKYKHNVFPGRAGQGTANMQMAPFNLKYAQDIPELADKVKDFGSVDGKTDEELNQLLSLVNVDEFNFGSGAWFLTTQCDKDVQDKLDENIDDGFKVYMACVGVDVTPERTAYLDRAKEAFELN